MDIRESVVKAAIRELVDILVKAVTQDCQESVDTLESQVFPDIVVCRDILVSRASQVIAEYRDSLVLPDIVELQVYLVTQVFLDIVVILDSQGLVELVATRESVASQVPQDILDRVATLVYRDIQESLVYLVIRGRRE